MNDKALTASGPAPLTFDEMTRAAKAMAMSGYFADARDVSQAMVKVLAGAELGIGPFASMTGIHVIKGKPVLGANLIASLIKNDPRYDYRVKFNDDGCTVTFYENGEAVGESSFTASDAQAANLSGDNWRKYPRNMYFARAISNGARWYTPGIFGGSPVYSPDEFGLEVDEDGDIITGEIVEPEAPADYAPLATNGDSRGAASPQAQATRQRPQAPEAVEHADVWAWLDGAVTDGQTTLGTVANAAVMARVGYDAVPHALNAIKMWDGLPDGVEVTKGKSVTAATARALLAWLIERKEHVPAGEE